MQMYYVKNFLFALFFIIISGVFFHTSAITYTKDNCEITVIDGLKEPDIALLACSWNSIYDGEQFKNAEHIYARDFLEYGYRPFRVTIKNKGQQPLRITTQSMQKVRENMVPIKTIEDCLHKNLFSTMAMAMGFAWGACIPLICFSLYGGAYHPGVPPTNREVKALIGSMIVSGLCGSWFFSSKRIAFNKKLSHELNKYMSWQYNLYFRQLKPDESVEWLFVFPKNLKIDTITIPIYDMNNNIITNLEIPISF
jgi:hypothetical protein